ncbi:probable F-actin-capping protein subunit beta isoform X2 [Alnus glutinosa]|nr:probable F-actin-capping protein subunit beta isoform X2 [Alnus glutinosa]
MRHFISFFLIKKDGSKTGQGRRGYLQEGAWGAIHVIEVGPEEEGTAHYRLTSTVMLSLTTDNESSGTFSLSGSIRRQLPFRPYGSPQEFFCLNYGFRPTSCPTVLDSTSTEREQERRKRRFCIN